MSLFGSIQLAGNSLQATQLGLQVTGQNIANANTPGYLREKLSLTPAPGQKYGDLVIGLGVKVDGVVQQVDNLLEGRLRSAVSDSANSTAQSETYKSLEGVIGDLTQNGLGKSLNNFFSSINDVLNQPDSVPVRNLAVLKGQTLAGDISRFADQASQLRTDINKQVDSAADQINSLLSKIATLNAQVGQAQSGNPLSSDAVGLSDQRNQALQDLSKLVGITVEKQPDGSLNILAGGDLLVYAGVHKNVKAVQTTDRGQPVDSIEIVETQSPLQSTGGQVAGLVNARDQILGGYLDQLNGLSSTLIHEFNKVFSTGQGLTGYSQLTGQNAVNNAAHPLDTVGLDYPPNNGSFQLLVKNKTTGQSTTTNIQIHVNGLDSDTSLNDIVHQINTAAGASASVVDGKLKIASTGPDQTFAFANDTSGALASLGVNTFFTGSNAFTIGVNADIKGDPSKFAASRGGIGADTTGAAALAKFQDQALDSQGGQTLSVLQDRLSSTVAQGSSVAQSLADANSTFEQTLNAQHLAVSGVNIDEEAINLIQYQRVYQASAKYITTLNDLLDTLVKL